MTRVLLTLGRLNRGGAEMRLLRLFQAAHARKESLSPVVFVVSGKKGTLDDACVAAGVRLIYGRPGLAGLACLYRTCRLVRPDIVHANVLLASGLHLLVAWIAGVRVRIAHIRNTGYDRDDLFIRIRNRVFRSILNLFSTAVVGVCDGAKEFSGASLARWKTIYNGVEVSDAIEALPKLGDPKELLEIVFLGRLHPQKNPVRAVKIMSIVRAMTGARCRLRFVGRSDGASGDATKFSVNEAGLENVIEFCDETDQPLAVLASSHVLLLTSVREGLPGVVLEALSCGTPVVASALPGVAEVSMFCEGVIAVDLAEPDEKWAEAIVLASEMDRGRIAKSFRVGPFTLDAHYREMMSLWGVRP